MGVGYVSLVHLFLGNAFSDGNGVCIYKRIMKGVD